MDFRTELSFPASMDKISHGQKILLIGSCFSDHIGQRLADAGFDAWHNPFGTVYNARSIEKQLGFLAGKQLPDPKLIGFQKQENLFFHYDVHSSFKTGNEGEVLEAIAKAGKWDGAGPDVCFVTLGTSWIYEIIEQKQVVANCHKMPAHLFEKRLYSIEECVESLRVILSLFPTTRFIWTVSPVRHIKDGLIANARSKAVLLEAVHRVCAEGGGTYFPAYEWLLDDLRDYRFFDKDMIHPSPTAVDYVWQKFRETYFTEKTDLLVRKYQKLRQMEGHRPFREEGESYQKHLEKTNLLRAEILKNKEEDSQQ